MFVTDIYLCWFNYLNLTKNLKSEIKLKALVVDIRLINIIGSYFHWILSLLCGLFFQEYYNKIIGESMRDEIIEDLELKNKNLNDLVEQQENNIKQLKKRNHILETEIDVLKSENRYFKRFQSDLKKFLQIPSSQ